MIILVKEGKGFALLPRRARARAPKNTGKRTTTRCLDSPQLSHCKIKLRI